MDKKQAQAIIKETFEKPFDKAKFTGFVKNLLNTIQEDTFTYRGNYIPDAYEQYINTLERIGKYSDGEHKIDILIAKLKKETSIERARTMQRNFIAWYLNGSRGGELKDAALVAFVAPNEEDWRFSLVKMDYRIEEGKNGRMRVKEDFTPARRWSFLVGKNENSHTAQSQLVDLVTDDERNPTLAQLEEAFSIEKVTKEFFEKYRGLFLWTEETLEDIVKKDKKIRENFEAKGVNTVDFSKKLLGQIVFLYFLQKKGWFGVTRDADWGTGPKGFLRELFESKHGSYKNFFNDILEPLFYEALRIDRSHDDDYYSKLNCRIPFLNGGLFDPINNYDWVHTDILLPNDLFSNSYKTKEGDNGNGILDIFDRYNFTVKEDEPLEKEVAVDPEMLGKVFENLLEVKDRKSKGTYYTPREIVHYMCQQSVINYLVTELEGKVSKEDIETLVKHGEHLGENETTVEAKGRETNTYFYKLPDGIRQNPELIDKKLVDIKVCDPAIGSGAFPVGMMGEIVKTRNVLSAYIKGKDRTIYNFKRACIEKSLYGVDIDPGAAEIAKLRLWLSLVVDEDDIEQIKPLPNLDYKIICGNSLLGVEKDLFNSHLFSELERLKPLLFNEINPKKKQEYKKQIDELIAQITHGHKAFDFEVYFSEVFHEKKGFNVVIANPPYVRVDDLNIDLREKYKNIFKSAVGKYDLYYLFFEKSFSICQKQGICVFISPNKFCAADSAETLRNLLFNFIMCGEILSTSKLKVFQDAANYPVISILRGIGEIQQFYFREASDIENLRSSVKEYSLDTKQIRTLPKSVIPINIDQNSLDLVLRLYKEHLYLEELISISEGLRIPGKYESTLKEVYEIVKQYQFSKYSKITKGSYILEKHLLKVLSDNSERYKRIMQDKIVIAEDALEINATIDTRKMIPQGGVYFAVTKYKNLELKIILALLNSKLLSFLYKSLYAGMHMGGGYLRYRSTFLEKLPITKAILNLPEGYRSKVIDLVDRIYNNIEEIEVKKYERQIDQMVYKLYGLTKEEIAIVEQSGAKE